jgi:CheY-like chemotaxis protein
MTDNSRANILIVDDLPEKLVVYQSILEELRQNMVLVNSGAEALKEVLQHEFAVILLDINMPGMDGFETATLIRKRKRSAHTPIIFITAFADDLYMAQSYAHGAVDFISSPVVPEILRSKVRVFVDLYRMTQQVKRQASEHLALVEEKTRRAAAEESNRRLKFMARAGSLLGRSLDTEETACDLAQLPIPFLADVCAVVLPESGGCTPRVVQTPRRKVASWWTSRPTSMPCHPGWERRLRKCWPAAARCLFRPGRPGPTPYRKWTWSRGPIAWKPRERAKSCRLRL